MEEFKIHVEKMCQHYNELTASYSAPTTNDLEYYHYTTLNYYKDLDEMLLPLHSLYMNYLLLAVLEPAHHNDLIHLINDFIRHVPEFRKYSTFKTYHHLFIAQDSVPLHAIERITGLIGMIKMQDDKSGPHQASNHAAIRAMEERITKMSTEKDKELETSICYTFREHFVSMPSILSDCLLIDFVF